jgi:hypothetical protein
MTAPASGRMPLGASFFSILTRIPLRRAPES